MHKIYILGLIAGVFLSVSPVSAATVFNSGLYWNMGNSDGVALRLQQFLTNIGIYKSSGTGNLFSSARGNDTAKKSQSVSASVSSASVVKGNAVQATVVPPKVSVSPKASSSPSSSSSGSVSVSTDISADISTEASVPASNASASGEIRLTAYTTSYTYWDNTPPGSSDISNPVIHDKAGGTGTYQDPITIAVGHVISGGKDTLDFPAGTKFYIPNVRKYFIVEDTCGDGNTPQNGPCHSLKTADKGAQVWLDMWIGGNSVTSSVADKCANILTANHLVIQNPSPSYAVVAGPVIGASCAAQFGDALVSA